jgi:hypothetical protein
VVPAVGAVVELMAMGAVRWSAMKVGVAMGAAGGCCGKALRSVAFTGIISVPLPANVKVLW